MDLRRYIDIINEAQRDPMDNPEFQKWFSGSKVVDDAGKPLVVYHGTKSNYEHTTQLPAYFTDDPSAASGYAFLNGGHQSEGNVRPAYLRILNPKTLGQSELDLHIRRFDWGGTDRKKTFWSLLNKKWIPIWKRQGYDGLYLHQVSDPVFTLGSDNKVNQLTTIYNQWVVFNADQIWPLFGSSADPRIPEEPQKKSWWKL